MMDEHIQRATEVLENNRLAEETQIHLRTFIRLQTKLRDTRTSLPAEECFVNVDTKEALKKVFVKGKTIMAIIMGDEYSLAEPYYVGMEGAKARNRSFKRFCKVLKLPKE